MGHARSTSTTWTSALVIGAALLAAAEGARAEPLLEGPYPFRKENTLALSAGYGFGPGDTPSGVRAVLEYGWMWEGSLWLDLQSSLLSSGCNPPAPAARCGATSGTIVDVMVGLAWKLQMDVPAVPYVRGVAGPMYFFPDGADNALGVGARVGVGAKYYLYEWFGLGFELGGMLGHAGFADDAMVSRTVHTLDVTLGAEVAF